EEDMRFQRTFFGPHERWMPIWIGLMRVRLWWYVVSSMKEGLSGDLRGEGRLLGGVFLIANDELVWSYLEKEWGDKPEVEEIKQVVEKFARKIETSGSFYRICMIGAFIDIISLVNMHVGSVLPSRGFFLQFFLSSILVGQTNIAIAWGVRYAQGMTAIVLAVNRLTAVLSPLKFSELWTDRKILLANMVQIVPGLFMGAGIYTGRFAYRWTAHGGIYCFINEKAARSLYYIVAGFIQTAFVFYIVINYIIIFRRFRKLSRLRQGRWDEIARAKKCQEDRLLFISIVICTLEVSTWIFSLFAFVIWPQTFLCKLMLYFQKHFRISLQIPSRLFHMIFDNLYDLYACTPPYLLIFFSTPFQIRFRTFLG
ncbi:hypothetical protein PMAYCL1PPCAC_13165, partial [Pristionchus mayeri]